MGYVIRPGECQVFLGGERTPILGGGQWDRYCRYFGFQLQRGHIPSITTSALSRDTSACTCLEVFFL
jgi:hypothetical protein